ncbi:hypothetical protein HanXRQr2_Chr03g0136261 [Helianthus annuus]|uniref:Uncharacterized protein n=1 Tax=Helianthus annuus TaxID=4232 RepID=A0A251VDF7_HELAN|nr:hypothetical protein HanXRQr2_Chr03g0136261 [Helianthus annuus]KAJ0609897.1 hypothetical protein HanHA89_Chr03g0124891 [Helianthus annuus]KAJ0790807.1 hypothetical protein HanLR1_Chr00c3411g0878451 [Helianthus annuus]
MIRRNRLVPRPRVTTLTKIRINKLFERLFGPFCTHSYPGLCKLLLESVHRWRLVELRQRDSLHLFVIRVQQPKQYVLLEIAHAPEVTPGNCSV